MIVIEVILAFILFLMELYLLLGFPGGSDGKESTCNERPGLDPWVGVKEGNGLSTPVFLPGESHGQRSLVGYSPWGCKESSMSTIY